uniref:Uncharacterized protein n=1 Tax=Trypanosoma congolense (strain IL3000) TaxID=1068625 RepID=G0UU13_TRYCI|nr:hypothetical protein, unlikely [Trypanosoma congolense IL3000]
MSLLVFLLASESRDAPFSSSYRPQHLAKGDPQLRMRGRCVSAAKAYNILLSSPSIILYFPKAAMPHAAYSHFPEADFRFPNHVFLRIASFILRIVLPLPLPLSKVSLSNPYTTLHAYKYLYGHQPL